MKLLVCGGRDYTEAAWAFHCLDRVDAKRQVLLVIHGGADGADRLAELWARARGISWAMCAADWKRNGRAAGPIRNQAMLAIYKPDGVVAFPGGDGTLDMVTKARARGVTVWEPGAAPEGWRAS